MSNSKKKSASGKKATPNQAKKPTPKPVKPKSIVDTLTGPELKLALIDCLKKIIKVKESAPKEAPVKAKEPVKNKKIELKNPVPVTPTVVKEQKAEATPKPKVAVDEFFAAPFKGASEEIPPVHDQDFYIGKRNKRLISDSPIFLERFGYTHEVYNDVVPCDRLHDMKTGEVVGTIPRISVYTVWQKAHKWAANPKSGGITFNITRKQWDDACKKLVALIGKNKETAQPMISNIMSLSELTFEELFLSAGSEAIKLIKAAIAYEMDEIETLKSKWKKIKRYIHKVGLHQNDGGIFTQAEVEVLNGIGLFNLNDLRKQNIFTLKHYLIFRDFSGIVEEINAAFKEDLEKRKDKRYKVYPFVLGYPALAVAAVLSYIFKYTLIKDAASNTPIINAMGAVWVISIIIMIRGYFRGKRRHRTNNPGYKYFTRKVKRATGILTLATLVIFTSSAVYYHRYDGYNNTVYYRDINKDTVAIAGLRDEKASDVIIPSTLDGKTVTEVDWYAFKGDNIKRVTLPDTVTKIDKYAFQKCDNLATIYQNNQSVVSIGKKAFNKCTSLVNASILSSTEQVSASAFEGCKELLSADFDALTKLGKKAFKGCESLDSIALGNKLETIPESAFEGCEKLVYLQEYASVTKVSEKAFYGCGSLVDISFDSVKVIEKEAFKDCISFKNVVVTANTEQIGKKAFGGCTNIEKITLPFIGKNLKSSEKQSLSYVMSCAEREDGKTFEVVLQGIEVVHGKSFNDCGAVVGITLPETVKEIKAGAFDSAKGLIYINIPDSVEVLNKNLFKNCASLTTVTGGKGIKTIGDGVFSGCSSLQSVDFVSLEEIGKSAFLDCESLTSIGGAEKIKQVGDFAFSGCESLKTMNLSSCETLGKSVFDLCVNLESVELASSITKIPDGMFFGCNALTTFALGNTVKEIGKGAFENSGITNINLNSVEIIGNGAFVMCENLYEVVIPNTVEKIGEEAFGLCENLSNVTSPFFGKTPKDTKNGYKHMFGKETDVRIIKVTNTQVIGSDTFSGGKDVIESVILGEGVTEIAGEAFKGYSKLSTVEFPSTLKKIGEKGFNGAAVREINLKNTALTELGKMAFSSCEYLETVELPDSLKTIPESAFETCEALKYIYLNKVEVIEKLAFRFCGLTDLMIPSTVTKIGENSFSSCDDLGSVTIGNGLKEIPKEAFAYCTNLNYVIIPGNVKVIGESAFSGCSRIIDLYLQKGIEKIEKSAFANCRNIEALEIPTSVTSMGKGVFQGCDCLAEIIIPFIGSSVSKPSAMSYVTDSKVLHSIEVTDATKIAEKAFSSCSRLEVLILNEGITDIGEGVVDGCKYLVEVQLPKSAAKFKHLFPDYLFESEETGEDESAYN